MASTIGSRPDLRVIRGEAPAEWLAHGVVADLRAHPFRPGETPTLVTFRPDEERRVAVESGARFERLPAALWVRVVIEAARCLDEVAGVLGWSVERVAVVCERQLQARNVDQVVAPLAAATLGGYADLLVAGVASRGLGEKPLTLRLSDEMYGAWTAAALGQARDIEDWMREMIDAAPASAVQYEIAAARASRTLAEWVYAASLSAAASSIA